MLQNAPNCTIQKFFFGEACPRTPYQTHGYATRRNPPPPPTHKKNSWPPLANPAYDHELLLRNLFENPPWQTVDCVYYVICLCITKSF